MNIGADHTTLVVDTQLTYHWLYFSKVTIVMQPPLAMDNMQIVHRDTDC